MGKYALKRVLLLIPTMLLVCIIVFAMMRMVPGSAVEQVVYNYSQNGLDITLEEAEAKLGMDKPAVVQFFIWFGGILRGDFGQCLFKGETVGQIISSKLPVSIELTLLTLFFTLLFSVPLALYCAAHPDTVTDNVIRTISVIMASVPIFWIGTLVLVYPAVWWGFSIPLTYTPFTVDPLLNMKMFLVPALVNALTQVGMNIRSVRTMTLEVMRQDYVRTAWAKGARERRVMFSHAFRNALIPVITLFGGAIPGMIGGSVVIENMFNLPGIGQQVVDALTNRDYPLAQGCTVVLAIIVMLVNLLVDLAYKWCDPRVTLD